MVRPPAPKLFVEQFKGIVGGAAVPSGTYYKSTVGFPINGILIWNNSPVGYLLAPDPSKAGMIIPIPPFFSLGTQVPAWTSFALIGDGTTPFASSTLSFQLQSVAPGVPFAGQFGPTAWGSGSVPNVVQHVNPGDQILAWNIEQYYDFLLGISNGNNMSIGGSIESRGGLAGPAGLILDDRDGVGGDTFTLLGTGGVFFLSSSVGGNLLSTDETGSLVAMGSGAILATQDRTAGAGHTWGLLANGNFGQITSSIVGRVLSFDEATGAVSVQNRLYPPTPAHALQGALAVYAGTGAPSNANGIDGDIYLRSDGGSLTTIYQRRAGSWVGIV